MFHRLLGDKRVRLGCGTEFFEVESGEMAGQIERIGKIFSQLQAAKDTVRSLATTCSSGAARRPEPKDLGLRQRLVELKQERGALDLQIELLELKLKQRIGAAEGIAGVATWKTQDRRCFNERVFRERRPALYEETLERFHCLDRAAWKKAEPEAYEAIQTTCYQLSSGRSFGCTHKPDQNS